MVAMVRRQDGEIAALKQSLKEAEEQVTTKSSEAATWRRSVEINTTDADPVVGVEAEISAATKTARIHEALHRAEKMIRQLEEEREGGLQAVCGSQQEVTDLQVEMEGVTAAYSALETEFNRRDGTVPSVEVVNEAAAERMGEELEALKVAYVQAQKWIDAVVSHDQEQTR